MRELKVAKLVYCWNSSKSFTIYHKLLLLPSSYDPPLLTLLLNASFIHKPLSFLIANMRNQQYTYQYLYQAWYIQVLVLENI